jgi:hypothetical protein
VGTRRSQGWADDRLNDSGAALIESISVLRASGIPDLSEPAANESGGGGNAGVVDMSEPDEPYDPDAPRFEDYDSADAYLRDKRAHDAIPLSHLSVEQRRERWARGRKSG